MDEGRKWLGRTPHKCDICRRDMDWVEDEPWFVDGMTTMGPWAYMCARCFEHYGVGLGLGRGQKYSVNEPYEKLEG